MAKSYLNADEKENHLFILSLFTVLNDTIENYKCYTAQENKFLKYARTYLDKFNEATIGRLDVKFGKQLIRDLNFNNVCMIPDSRMVIEQKKSLNAYIISTDEYHDLCSLAGRSCRGCTSHCKDCFTYEFFIRKNVPFADDTNSVCPYQIPGETYAEKRLEHYTRLGTPQQIEEKLAELEKLSQK